MEYCARRSVCFCSQNRKGLSIGLLTKELQSSDWGRRAVRFVRLERNGLNKMATTLLM